ncbi:MAG: CPBP family intramembrane metalloprotease [Henriciella sp.]|nr:CPBP family intramembrane metalloprotease [Henriciella sp.]
MTDSSTTVTKTTALIDLALIIGVLLIAKTALLNVEAVWAYAGPISLLLALVVASWRLKAGGHSWRDLGVQRPKSWLWLAIQTVIALIVTIGVGILAQSLAVSVIGEASEATQAIDARFLGRFDNLPGNLPVYLFWLTMAWVIGGFTEEMLFRGALFSRFESLLADLPLAVILAIFCQAILFGQQHYYYQGLAGWVATAAIAVVSGLLYLAFKRNLWPLIISHGLSNTIGLTALYLGAMPTP